MIPARFPPLARAWPAFLLASLALSACAQPPGGSAGASAGTRAACRQRADEVYTTQNRADIYRSDLYTSGPRDAPFATTSIYGEDTRALSSRYAREQLLDQCVRGAAGNVGASTAPDPAARPVR